MAEGTRAEKGKDEEVRLAAIVGMDRGGIFAFI